MKRYLLYRDTAGNVYSINNEDGSPSWQIRIPADVTEAEAINAIILANVPEDDGVDVPLPEGGLKAATPAKPTGEPEFVVSAVGRNISVSRPVVAKKEEVAPERPSGIPEPVEPTDQPPGE